MRGGGGGGVGLNQKYGFFAAFNFFGTKKKMNIVIIRPPTSSV